ncbi:MAG TPA: hypothetical protein VIR16_12470, partial [Candidatus Limnocylindrales bacterium]
MLRWTLPAIALLVIAAACGSTPTPSPSAPPSPAAAVATASSPSASVMLATPTPGPSADPTPAPQWHDARIAQPAQVTGFASQPPGYYCDPCHNLSEDNLFGVGATSSGFIAVGAVTPPASAIAFWSADGASWAPLQGFASNDGSAALGAAEAGGRIVLVGHDPTGATAWVGSVQTGWTQAPSQASLAVPYAAGGMNAVVAFDGGFVAGGYRDDPSKAAAAAAVWRSKDGLTWTLDDDHGGFAGGRIMGLAVVGDALVAVGASGDQIRGPAAAWRWTASTGWRRADVPTGGGAM